MSQISNIANTLGDSTKTGCFKDTIATTGKVERLEQMLELLQLTYNCGRHSMRLTAFEMV
jgi:hypothetical protein